MLEKLLVSRSYILIVKAKTADTRFQIVDVRQTAVIVIWYFFVIACKVNYKNIHVLCCATVKR